MKIDLVLDELKKIKSSMLDDAVDRLVYVWTTFFLVFCVFVVGMQNTFKDPIMCMLPSNYPGTWVSYTNHYCYIQSTYHTSSGSQLTSNPKVEVGYYQWIPYTLAFQALSFATPHFLYLALVAFSSSGFNFKQIVERCAGVLSKKTEDVDKEVNEVAYSIYDYTSLPDRKKKLRSLGRSLTLSYLLGKGLNIAIVLANIYFLDSFVGKGNFGWAFTVVNQALQGRYWDTTGIFPRVTYCDTDYSKTGQPHTKTFQCLLMLNVLIEKIYVIIYFWLLFLLVTTVVNLIWIMYKLFAKNQSEVYTYAKPHFDNDNEFDNFIRYVADDGRLLIRFVYEHAGSRVAAKLVHSLVTYWTVKPDALLEFPFDDEEGTTNPRLPPLLPVQM